MKSTVNQIPCKCLPAKKKMQITFIHLKKLLFITNLCFSIRYVLCLYIPTMKSGLMVGGYSAVIFITCAGPGAGKQQLVHHHTHSHRVKVIAHTRHSLPHVWSQKSAKMQEITSVFDELIVLW